MNPQELRINNWVLSDGDLKQVKHGYDIDDAIYQYEPIPLTEEWLLKFGFIKLRAHFELSCKGFDFQYDGGGFRVAVGSCYGIDTNISTVHQLQNLYFALTGEELPHSNGLIQ